MRITGLSVVGLFVIALFPLRAADETPFASLARLATALSENDPDGALRYFDKQLKDYGAIEADIDALADQTDVSCSIDIVTDEESNGVHKLDLDWFMQLMSPNGDQQLERRRVRVQVEMRRDKDRWEITKFSPLSILDPIHIQ